MSEKEKIRPCVVDDESSNELHMQDDPENLPASGSQERAMAEHRLVRKMDTRLLPTLILIYILNVVDVCSMNFGGLLTLVQLLMFLFENSGLVSRLHG